VPVEKEANHDQDSHRRLFYSTNVTSTLLLCDPKMAQYNPASRRSKPASLAGSRRGSRLEGKERREGVSPDPADVITGSECRADHSKWGSSEISGLLVYDNEVLLVLQNVVRTSHCSRVGLNLPRPVSSAETRDIHLLGSCLSRPSIHWAASSDFL